MVVSVNGCGKGGWKCRFRAQAKGDPYNIDPVDSEDRTCLMHSSLSSRVFIYSMSSTRTAYG